MGRKAVVAPRQFTGSIISCGMDGPRSSEKNFGANFAQATFDCRVCGHSQWGIQPPREDAGAGEQGDEHGSDSRIYPRRSSRDGGDMDPMTAPLTEERLAEWEAQHRAKVGEICRWCRVAGPYPVALLVAEVRRLRREVDKWEKWNKGWSKQ